MRLRLFGAVGLLAIASACSSSPSTDATTEPGVYTTRTYRLTLTQARTESGEDVLGKIGELALLVRMDTSSRDGKLLSRSSGTATLVRAPGATIFLGPLYRGAISTKEGAFGSLGLSVERSEDEHLRRIVLAEPVSRYGIPLGASAFSSVAYVLEGISSFAAPPEGISVEGGELTASASVTLPGNRDVSLGAKLVFRMDPDRAPPDIRQFAVYPGGKLPMWILPEQVYDTPVSFEAPVLLKLGDEPPFEYNPSKGGFWNARSSGTSSVDDVRKRTLILPPGRDLSGRDVPARDVVFDPLDVPSRDAWDFATDVPVMAGGAEQRADPSCEGPRCIAIRSKVAADGSCEMPANVVFTMPASRDGRLRELRIRVRGQADDAWSKVFTTLPVLYSQEAFGYEGRGPTGGPGTPEFPYDSGWIDLETSSRNPTFVVGIYGCQPGLEVSLQSARTKPPRVP